MSHELESLEARRRFLFRCFPSVLAGILLGCVAMAQMLLIARLTWAEILPFSIVTFLPEFTMVLIMVSCLGNAAIIRGWPQGVWAVIGMFVTCLLVVVPTFRFDQPRWLYVAGVCSPLLGLLAVNSQRHREFRRGCEWIRLWVKAGGTRLSAQQKTELKRAGELARRERNRQRKRLDEKFR